MLLFYKSFFIIWQRLRVKIPQNVHELFLLDKTLSVRTVWIELAENHMGKSPFLLYITETMHEKRYAKRTIEAFQNFLVNK